MNDQPIIVLITVPTSQVGEEIARMLLERKLAACINLLPGMSSLFTWKGKIEQEQECLMLVKTRTRLFEDRFLPAVKAIHPYEVPEIIALPILMGLESYLNWIDEETTQQN